MKRNTLATVLIGFLLLPACADAVAAPAARLITHRDAARHGLRRAWFSQIRIDPGQSRISHVRLVQGAGQLPDTLLVQTDRAMIHAIDAETGRTLWVRLAGSPAHPSMAVGASDKLVGVLNGTRLYLLDRSDGRVLWSRRVDGVPADGPALSSKYVFAPMISGHVLAYPIEKKQFEEESETTIKPPVSSEKSPEEEATATPESEPPDKEKNSEKEKEEERPLVLKQEFIPPLTCVSFGRVTCQPIFTLEDRESQYVAWATTRGLFVGYVALRGADEFAVKYQLRTRSQTVAQPTYLPPNVSKGNRDGLIFTTSEAGEVHAISATRGAEKWQYAVGQPIVEPVVPIGDRAYVVTELGSLLCLGALTGDEHWSTNGVGQFIAASQQRIYVADRAGQIRVLDPRSGAVVNTLYAADLPLKFRNLWTDRIYLATPTGLIQCLHETALAEPLRHQKIEQLQVEEASGEEFIPTEPKKPEENPFEAPQQGEPNPSLD